MTLQETKLDLLNCREILNYVNAKNNTILYCDKFNFHIKSNKHSKIVERKKPITIVQPIKI